MRLIHWLFQSHKKRCRHFCVTCKYYYECNPMSFDQASKKLDRIDEKIKRTTKRLDRYIEEYKQVAKVMR